MHVPSVGQLARLATSVFAAVTITSLPLPAAHAVTIDMVTVRDAGNAADTTGYGAVNYDYKIGTSEVTIGQYTAFLNTVAASDPYSLYDPGMGSDLNAAGITRSGSSGSYSYSAIGPFGTVQIPQATAANRPVTFVNWFDAARFANWMHNGQGSGDTETGAYTLVGGQTSGAAPAKNPGAQFYIPTENEWYKAAYYSPVKGGVGSPGYYTYATQSDAPPGNVVGSGTNQANYVVNTSQLFSVTQSSDYDDNQNLLTDVGAFSSSMAFYGTFDQSGNVNEWNDLAGSPGTTRGVRGGSAAEYTEFVVSSAYRAEVNTSLGVGAIGFRLASPVSGPSPIPEIDPAGICSVLALVTGVLGLLERRHRSER